MTEPKDRYWDPVRKARTHGIGGKKPPADDGGHYNIEKKDFGHSYHSRMQDEHPQQEDKVDEKHSKGLHPPKTGQKHPRGTLKKLNQAPLHPTSSKESKQADMVDEKHGYGLRPPWKRRKRLSKDEYQTLGQQPLSPEPSKKRKQRQQQQPAERDIDLQTIFQQAGLHEGLMREFDSQSKLLGVGTRNVHQGEG